jgi:outer membrane protein assembly factor BamB
VFVAGLLGLSVASVSLAAEPAAPVSGAFQFRGPGGTGVSAETGLPVKWGPEENVRWKVPLPGRGLSNPVVAGGRVFLTACTGDSGENLHVLCLSLADGKKLWERRLRSTGLTGCHPKTNMAAPTPVADGKRVYALFATNDLVAFDLDGNLAWYRSLVRDHPPATNQVGAASSPTISGDTLIVPVETIGVSFVAGLDAATGADRWKLPRHKDINWTTPLVAELDGKPAVLLQSRVDLTAADPATGKALWKYDGKGLSPIPSPTVGGGLVFAPGAELTALKPQPRGEPPEVAWKSPKVRAATASPLFYKGRLYVVSGPGILTCADPADGKVLWQERLSGPFAASPLAADGKIYLVNEEGTVTVVDPETPKRVIASNSLGETILASPVAADGALLFRSDKTLWCVGAKR